MRGRSLVAVTVLLGALAIAAPPGAAAAAKHEKALPSITAIKGVQKLEATALRRWPDSFGGMWLSNGKLFVAFAGKARQRTKKLRKPLVKNARATKRRARGNDRIQLVERVRTIKRRIRAVMVDDSLKSLRQLQDRMIADRDAPPPPALLVAPRYDLDIDVRRNSVVVITPNPTAEAIEHFRQTYGDVIVEQGPLIVPQPEVGCSSRDSCFPFLRSGLRSQAESGTSCSLAFGVLYQAGFEKVDGILSAAHCGNPDADLGDDRSIGGVLYGQVVAESQAGKLDAELHSVDNGYVSFFPLLYRTPADYAAAVGKVGAYDGLLIGSTVCKSGYKTGESCGQVLSKFASPTNYVSGASSFIRTDYCSQGGDSGAGVYSSFQRQKPNKKKPVTRYEALGVHSGGTDVPCSDPGHSAVFGHIEFVQSTLNVKVLANPN